LLEYVLFSIAALSLCIAMTVCAPVLLSVYLNGFYLGFSRAGLVPNYRERITGNALWCCWMAIVL